MRFRRVFTLLNSKIWRFFNGFLYPKSKAWNWKRANGPDHLLHLPYQFSKIELYTLVTDMKRSKYLKCSAYSIEPSFSVFAYSTNTKGKVLVCIRLYLSTITTYNSHFNSRLNSFFILSRSGNSSKMNSHFYLIRCGKLRKWEL